MELDEINVTIRPFRLTDVDDFTLWACDHQVMKFIRWPHISIEEASSFIEGFCIPHPWCRSICIDDRSIGFVSAFPESDEDRCRADIASAVARRYWGKGIATKVLRIAIDEVFESFPEVVRLQAFANVENKASIRVLEKVGFRREGVLKNYCYVKGKMIDCVILSFLLQERDRSGLKSKI